MTSLTRIKIALLLVMTIGLLTTLFVREGTQFLRAGEDHYQESNRSKERNLKNATLASRLIENKIESLRTAAQAIAYLAPDRAVIEANGRVEHFLDSEKQFLPEAGMLLFYPNRHHAFRLASTSPRSPELLAAMKQTKWNPSSFTEHKTLLAPISSERFAIAFRVSDTFSQEVVVFTYLEFPKNFFENVDANSTLRLFSEAAAGEALKNHPNTLDAFVEIPGTGIGVYGEFKANSFDRFEPVLSQRTQVLGLFIFLMALGTSFLIFGKNDFVQNENTEAEAQTI